MPLTSDIIFPAISLFMLLQFPLAMVSPQVMIALPPQLTPCSHQFSQVTSSIIEAMVSINRLSKFLAADELQSNARKVSINSDLRTGDIVKADTVLPLGCPY